MVLTPDNRWMTYNKTLINKRSRLMRDLLRREKMFNSYQKSPLHSKWTKMLSDKK